MVDYAIKLTQSVNFSSAILNRSKAAHQTLLHDPALPLLSFVVMTNYHQNLTNAG
jgi:hypothetical protein